MDKYCLQSPAHRGNLACQGTLLCKAEHSGHEWAGRGGPKPAFTACPRLQGRVPSTRRARQTMALMGAQYPGGTASTHTTAPGRPHLRDNIIAQSSTRAIRTANWLVVHTWSARGYLGCYKSHSAGCAPRGAQHMRKEGQG
ncbi:hypothetical protein V6N13_048489 [Hibiscus sabdariffa]